MRSPLPIKRSLSSKRKQKGAVAIVLGLSLVTLFAMGGVVLDCKAAASGYAEYQNSYSKPKPQSSTFTIGIGN